jgi:hypothetical protein
MLVWLGFRIDVSNEICGCCSYKLAHIAVLCLLERSKELDRSESLCNVMVSAHCFGCASSPRVNVATMHDHLCLWQLPFHQRCNRGGNLMLVVLLERLFL